MDARKTLMEKVLSGEISVSSCDVESDFSLDELEVLLDRKMIEPLDLSEAHAAELIVKGVLSMDDFPFEAMRTQSQIRLLKEKKIDRDEFIQRVDWKACSGSDWLQLLVCCHSMIAEAPFEKIRAEASVRDWVAAIRAWPLLFAQVDRERLYAECTTDELADICKTLDGYEDGLERVMKDFMDDLTRMPITAENDLEKAILDRDYQEVIRQIVACRAVLTRPHILGRPEFICAPEVIGSMVMLFCIETDFFDQFPDFWKENVGGQVNLQCLMDRLCEDIKKKPGADEQLLRDAIRQHSDEEVLALVEHVQIGMSPQFTRVFQELPKLKKATVVALFQKGIKPIVLPAYMKWFMEECQRPQVLKNLRSAERLMYANLMLHVITGEITSDDRERIEEDWYPMGDSRERHSYRYYYDPESAGESCHSAEEGYEKPRHAIHRDKSWE